MAAPPGSEPEGRRFYGDLLGLEEVAKPGELRASGGVWFALGEGEGGGPGQELHIGIDADFAAARKAHPGLQVASVAELEALAEKLTRAGAPVSWDERFPGRRRFYTEDPWGNRLELFAFVVSVLRSD